jgi:heptosyltransferase II
MGFPDPPASLLVRATNWLGDAVMTTPALAAVREGFPDARIVLLARPLVAELFRHHPDVDEVMVYELPGRHEGALGRLRLAGEVRRRRFDGALLLQNAFDAALIAFLGRIPERAGYPTDGRRILLTLPVPLPPGILERHEVEYYLCLLDGMGIPRPVPAALKLAVTEEEREAMATRLAFLGIERGASIVTINPGATYGSAKRWYPDRFAAVADTLSGEWGAGVVVVGSTAEAPLAGEIETAMRNPPVNLAGKTTVRELMALLSLSSARGDLWSHRLAAHFPVVRAREGRPRGDRLLSLQAAGVRPGARVHARCDARNGGRRRAATAPGGTKQRCLTSAGS